MWVKTNGQPVKPADQTNGGPFASGPGPGGGSS
jgi:hypothetical protein